MARLDELIATYGTWDGAAGDVAEAEGDLLSVLKGQGALHEQQLTALDATNKAYEEGTLTFPQYIAGLDMVADMTGNVTKAMTEANTPIQEYLSNLRDVSDNGQTYISTGAGLVAVIGNVTGAIRRENVERSTASKEMQRYLDLEQQIAGAAVNSLDVAHAQEGLQRGIAAASDAMTYQVGESQRLADALADDAKAVAELGEKYADTFNQMQSDATAVVDSNEAVFRAIIGNTDAIASQSQAVMDWADKLIGASGTVAEIDTLLADGAITLDDYTAAQGAYNDIAAANASIQQDVLSIQTQLAPVIAQSTEALAEQMDAIANGSTDAQLFALGMMDSATATQALGLAQAYLSDQDAFGPMMQQAAELNPMLAQILEEMGLISYNPATGEVSLNGADEAQSELSLLTDAITQLDGTLATLNAILNDDASGPIGDVAGAASDLDGTTATVFANLVDNASGGIAAAHAALMALDGASATAYITTIATTIGSPFAQKDGGMVGRADGGMLARANGGGIPFIGAEGTGFELMRRGDGGGMQMLPSPGVYSAPQGSMVFPHGASMSMMDAMGGGGINVHIAGSVYGVDDLVATVASGIAQGMVASRDRYVRGHGV